ncbi:MAG: hypothetical protein NTV29_02890 [Planctomycetota bacterium]|nr:hypothetical protein [Planctomycetota bacterium]
MIHFSIDDIESVNILGWNPRVVSGMGGLSVGGQNARWLAFWQ